jgi:DNA-binding NtrC family response regulator
MKPARILVVDDELGMLRAVERILSDEYHVTATPLPGDALSWPRRSFRISPSSTSACRRLTGSS